MGGWGGRWRRISIRAVQARSLDGAEEPFQTLQRLVAREEHQRQRNEGEQAPQDELGKLAAARAGNAAERVEYDPVRLHGGRPSDCCVAPSSPFAAVTSSPVRWQSIFPARLIGSIWRRYL